MKNLQLLQLCLSFLLLVQGSCGVHAVASKDQRHLQTPSDFELEATAVYDFVFDNITPETNPSVVEMEELVRLTEIFYRRTFASAFPNGFQSVLLNYKSHTWDPSFDSLSVNFGASLTFGLTGDIPSPETVLDVFTNVESENYIKHYVSMAEPSNFFLWTNATQVQALLKSIETPYTTALPSPSIAPASLPLTLFEPSLPTDASNATEPVSTDIQTTVSPTILPTQEQIPIPEPVKPEYLNPSPTFQQGGIDKQEDTGGLTSSEENENTFESGQIIADQSQAALLSAFRNELTATKMFLWMMAARFLFFLASLMLQRWSISYQGSDKKAQLKSYWTQFILYVPLLAVFTLSLIAVQNENDYLVKIGLLCFSHASMMLLAVQAIEVFLRAMNKILLVQRFILIATILFVMNIPDSGLQNPLDIIAFGAMECMGVCSELASQWALISYRSWSDAPLYEKERVRHGVAYILQVSLSCTAISKILFFSSSIVWYVLRFDNLTGSYLVFVLPTVRLIQVPTLLWSFYAQVRLYNQVASALSHKDVEGKHYLESECEEEESTEQGSQREQQDV